MILKKEVLHVFKELHKARKLAFQNDIRALEAARSQINSEFIKNKHVSDEEAIKELIKLGQEVTVELRTAVAQLELKEPGVFSLKMRPELIRLDNCQS